MTSSAESRQPLVLEDEWEPPPRRDLRFPVFLAAIGLLIAGVGFATMRAVGNGESARLAQDWEAQQPVRDLPAESPWSPILSAKPLIEDPEPPPPPPMAPRRQPAPRKLAFRPPSPEERGGHAMRPPAPSYVSINSKPWSAVSVDGHVIGNTPLRGVRVTPGRHQLVLSHEGFETVRMLVTVPTGDTLRITDIVLKRSSP